MFIEFPMKRVVIAVSLICPLQTCCQAVDIWDMTEVRTQPLDTEVVGERKAPLYLPRSDDWMSTGDDWVAKETRANSLEENKKSVDSGQQLLVVDFFISCDHTPDGPNRIFCASARPENATGPVPVILVFHGGGGHASGALALAIARRHPGMAAIAMDYNGQLRPGPEGRVTVWRSFDADNRQRAFELVPDLTNWPLRQYVIAARRTIDYLETQPWADPDRVGAVGISYGGWVALMLAGVDDRVKCVTTAVSAGGAQFTAGRSAQTLRWEPAEQRQLWLDNYEPLAHAPNTKAAVCFSLSTNDLFFWLNGAEKNRAAIPNQKCWLLRPNSNHGSGGPPVPDDLGPALMTHVLADGPPVPEVTEFQVSEDGQQFTWKAVGPHAFTRAVLNWSPADAVSPARYWIELPATRDGDSWTADAPAGFGAVASQSFVNLGDQQGVVVSSTILHHPGIDSMRASGPQWPEGQLWDTQRGDAAWRSPAGWMAKTAFSVNKNSELQVGPQPGGKDFHLLTNSAVLASGIAATHKGIYLKMNGNGLSGALKVILLRDTNSLDERVYTAEVNYSAAESEHEIAWSDFQLTTADATAPTMPSPFDGLIFSGTRQDGSSISIQSISLHRP